MVGMFGKEVSKVIPSSSGLIRLQDAQISLSACQIGRLRRV